MGSGGGDRGDLVEGTLQEFRGVDAESRGEFDEGGEGDIDPSLFYLGNFTVVEITMIRYFSHRKVLSPAGIPEEDAEL